MDYVVLLSGLVVVIWIIRKSNIRAFLDVYLPTVLCIPAWPRLVLPGLPDPTFQEAAILPIAAVFLIRSRKLYHFSPFDLLIFSFIFIQGLSEYLNTGYADAQNLLFDVVVNGLFPYVLAKSFLQTFELRKRFLRRFVWCVCVVIAITLYEVRFSYNPYKFFFGMIFPSQADVWVTTFRYGLARVAGPYGHAILAGIIFMIAIRLQSWLRRAKMWEPTFRPWHFGKMSKARILALWTVLGLILTWVRGPQFGAVLAWIVSMAARGKNPRKRLGIALLILGLMIIPLALWGYSYASIGRSSATTAAQESAAYRKELLDGYITIVRERLWIGWGRNGWPQMASMPSIDNYYLLVALMHGTISLGFLISILVVISVRLYRTGVKTAKTDLLSSSLSFELLGIFIGFAFSIGTVYVGESVFSVFFLLLGFTEAFLASCGQSNPTKRVAAPKNIVELPPFRFKRVVT